MESKSVKSSSRVMSSFMLLFGFRSIMDWLALGVRVLIGSSHFEFRFGYGFGSFSSGFRSGVSYEHIYVLFLGFLGSEITQVRNLNGVVMHISGPRL